MGLCHSNNNNIRASKVHPREDTRDTVVPWNNNRKENFKKKSRNTQLCNSHINDSEMNQIIKQMRNVDNHYLDNFASRRY